MSLQLPRRFNFAKLSAVISLLMTSNTLYAANIGATHINSNQYEPLSATIDVNNINSDTFSVSLADSSTYQQLGLNATSTMSARFVKTSANTGQVIITTSTPIVEPFTDIVLEVNDNGNNKVIPKTLLLPISNSTENASSSQAIPKTNSQTTGNTAQPNLPVVSSTPPVHNTGTPLAVKKTDPPPLQPSLTDSAVLETNPSDMLVKDSAQNTTDFASTASNHDIQLDILNIQVHRTYRTPTGEIINTQTTALNTETKEVAANEALQATATEDNHNINTEVVDDELEAATSSQSSPDNKTAPSIALGTATYTVQRNDNLWTIASQIAKENNMDVHTVMEQIQTHNQDAFINNDISLLKANATLTLPDYEVIPSKLGIRAATAARQAQNQTASSSRRNNNRSSQTRSSGSRTARTAQALPSRPQVTLVTPGSSGSATGSQTRNVDGTGLNSDLASQLQSTRQQTANRAQQVRSLSNQLSESTRQIQLQNKRLAELEQRLRNLRNN